MVDTLPPSNAPKDMEPWIRAMEKRVKGSESLARQTATQNKAVSKTAEGAVDSATQANTQITDAQRIPAQVNNLVLAGVAYYDNEGISRAYIDVTWDAVVLGLDGAPVTGVQYEVWYRNQNEPVTAMRRSTLTAEVTTRINNLESGMGYYVCVRAITLAGVAGDYSIVRSTVTPSVTTVPPTPSTPAVSSSLGTVSATWNGLDSAGNAMPNWVTKVQLFVSTTVGGTYTPTGVPLSKSGSVVVSGLTVGATYYFKLGSYSYSGTQSLLSGSTSNVIAGIAPVDVSGLNANLATMNANTANAFSNANAAFSNANAAFAQANVATAYGQGLNAQSVEIVINGSFETADWWTFTGGGGRPTTPVRTGLRSGGLNGAASTPQVLSPMIPTVAGKRYRISFWYRTGAVLPTGGWRLATAANGTINSIQMNFALSNGVWTQYTSDFTIPAGTTEFRLRWAVSNTEVWYIDDVSLLDISDVFTANATATSAYTQANTAYGQANTAYTRANSAYTQANTATTAATTAQSTADGKNKTYTSTAPASGTSYVEGDIWYQNVAGVTVGQWRFTSGAWVAQPLAYTAIASVDAGTISVGFLNGARLQANSIDGGVITANTLYANNVIVPNTIIASDLIVPGSILAGLLGVGSVLANNIQTGAVTADAIEAGAVTATAIAADSIDGNHIRAGEIQTSHLSPDVGGTLDIAANDSINLLVGQVANVQSDVDSTADNLDAMQTFYQFGPTGAIISSPDSQTSLALRNDRIEILQSGAAVSYWDAGTMFVDSFVGEQVILGNHKIEKYGTGTVVRTL